MTDDRKLLICRKILLSLLGSEQLVVKWFTVPNRAFDGKNPEDVPVGVVLSYLQGFNNYI